MIFTVKIEQTFAYPKRMKYIAETDSFIAKPGDSLSYTRNVRQPYGWLKESGTPPCEHLDVIVMTDKEYELGDEDKVKIIGVFCRNDGDHKLVGVCLDRDIEDFSELSDEEKEDMHRLYPREDVGEGWFGRERAEEIIKDFYSKKKRIRTSGAKKMKLKIIPFDGKNAVHTAQAANILAECFPHCYADCAEEEIAQYPSDERIAFIAVEEESSDVLGFIGGIEDYDGNVWELHPLCVAKSRQRKGIGTLLLQALEAECAARGAMTVTLGTDDEFFSTTLSGCDLYDDLWGRISAIRNLNSHPYEFYLKNGYRITGVLPDANGCGKPDILMSKRVGSFSDRT